MRNAGLLTFIWALMGGIPLLYSQPADLLSHLQLPASQLFFEQNTGQFDSQIAYQCASGQTQVRFLANGLSIAQVKEKETGGHIDSETSEEYENYRWYGPIEPHYEALVWNLEPLNAFELDWQPYRGLPGSFHYISGTGTAKDAQRYAEVWAPELYTGIDLRYYGAVDHLLKYDFVVHPEGEVADIQMRATGVQNMVLQEDGSLTIQTEWGDLTEAKPFAYQVIRGQQIEVLSSYILLDDTTFGFTVGPLYDESIPLIIDPITLNWSTFFHTSLSDDYVISTYQDTAGYIYTTGYSKAVDFPVTPGVYQDSIGGNLDVFVSKFYPGGGSLVYNTFIGGISWELGYGLAVTEKGEAIVSGFSQSTDFPVTSGVYQTSRGGGDTEGFLLKLSEAGDSLLFSTHIGGSDREYFYDLALADNGDVYLAGYTQSSDFPVTSAAYDTSYAGSGDGVILKMNSTGTSLIYSTLLGGINFDLINSLALQNDGQLWVGGYTSSTDYPVTADAFQDSLVITGVSQQDGFFARINADGDSLVYSSYLGGDRSDDVQALTVAPNGDLVLGGYSFSWDWPTTSDAVSPSLTSSHGNGEATLMRFDPSGQTLLYGTLLGGEYMDYVKCLQVKDTHEVYMLGATQSSNFPVTSGANGHAGGYDVFVSVINTNGGGLIGSGLFGGALNDYPRSNSSMKIDSNQATIAITTHSTGMPTTGSTLQTSKTNGNNDAPWLGSVNYDVILPVQNRSLTADWIEPGISEISWVREQEEVESYTVVRKGEGETWKAIGKVDAQPGVYAYALQDAQALPYVGKTLYYRVKSRDLAGNEQMSNTVSLSIPSQIGDRLHVFPNPAKNKVSISFSSGEGTGGTLVILDPLGRMILRRRIDASMEQIDLPLKGWQQGLYWVSYTTGTGNVQREALLVK